MILFLVTFLVAVRIAAAAVSLLWPPLLVQAARALQSQRDLQAPITLGQILSIGVNLSSLVFDPYSYSEAVVPVIYSLLNSGVRTFALDAFYNQYTGQWQLCPGPFPRNSTVNATTTVTVDDHTVQCNPTFSIALFMLSMRTYFLQTNTTQEATFIEVLFSLKPIVASTAYDLLNTTLGPDPVYAFLAPSSWGTPLLAEALDPAQPFIYTPRDTLSDVGDATANTSLSPLNVTLFSKYRRMLVNANEVSPALGYNFSDQDKLRIFFQERVPTTLLNTLDTGMYNLCVDTINLAFLGKAEQLALQAASLLKQEFHYVIDTPDNPFTNATLKNYARCGFSPILNTMGRPSNGSALPMTLPGLLSDYILPSLWSWAPDQPMSQFNETTLFGDKAGALNLSVTTRCIALYPDGWHVDNCYRQYHYACQNILDPFQWLVSDKRDLYFSTFLTHACTGEWQLGVPRLAREQLSLFNAIGRANASYPVWVDVNDVTVDGCYVSGGPYAQCPYIRQVDVRTFIRIIAPAAAVSLFVILLLFLERFCRFLPIRTHRKQYWKKRIAEESKTAEPEGVPL